MIIFYWNFKNQKPKIQYLIVICLDGLTVIEKVDV